VDFAVKFARCLTSQPTRLAQFARISLQPNQSHRTSQLRSSLMNTTPFTQILPPRKNHPPRNARNAKLQRRSLENHQRPALPWNRLPCALETRIHRSCALSLYRESETIPSSQSHRCELQKCNGWCPIPVQHSPCDLLPSSCNPDEAP
jgi:hypothetical protein